jgi:pimeloyl-ACP methyl ester carboxylesterase
MRLTRHHLFGICLSLLFINLSAQDKSIREDNINIGSHQLHYYCIGNGSPTIVLDVGIGETYRDWLSFFEKSAIKTQIFYYDRAGYGQSEMGTLPRDSKTEADELKTLLEKANIIGPYILIGHSLGALNLQIFASINKTDIAGMVLLDPPPLDWILGKGFPKLTELAEQTTKNFEQFSENMRNSENEGDRQKADFFKTLASEHREMFSNSGKQAAAISSFGDIPLIVIASGKPNPQMGEDAEKFQNFWNDQCKEISLKSKNGKYVLAAESSHYIYRDDPDIVLKALNELLSKSKH